VSLAVNDLSHADFVARLGGIYEHSPWVAERAFRARPFASIDSLHAAMNAAMHAATRDEKLALNRAHPELLCKLEAARLTESSRGEQAAAGLDRCTPEQKARMQALNRAYGEKFGFPFIVAVKGLDWGAIVERIEARLGNSPEQEFETALAEIGRIALFRLEAMTRGAAPSGTG
jgi:2-oxo-4-hydroxy-4-carboxy-5-ureidoimidazoline decarboxylase